MISVDINEPQRILKLISQSVEAEMVAANEAGLADFSWLRVDGAKVSKERKQADELLSTGLDEVETQLRRELEKCDDLELVIEGFYVPSQSGTIACKPQHGRSGIWIQQSFYRLPYAMVMAWFWGLNHAGVNVMFTSDMEGTAQYMVAAYKQDQKLEHTTLRRYTREKVVWHPDRRVQVLLAVKGLGVKRAEALLVKYESVAGVIDALRDDTADVASTEGMNGAIAGYTRLVVESEKEVVGQ